MSSNSAFPNDLLDRLADQIADRVIARLRPVPVKRAFRIPEVADLLSLSVRQVERLVANGELDSIRVGRVRLIASSAIDAFLSTRSRH
jgi:excisionase family DNA binding protein